MLRHLLKPIDYLLDGITMYRLLLYYLVVLLAAAIGLSAAGYLHYSAIDIAISAATLVIACWVINHIFARIFEVPVNPESSILTGLILSLIITPTFTNFGFLFLLAAAGLAMASKYLLTFRTKHVFNPAAIAVVLTAIGPRQHASWWVGTAVLLPFVIAGGVLVMRKTRREHMVLVFLLATTVTTAVLSVLTHGHIGADLRNMVLSSAAFYLGFVMLTEPYTSPTVHKWQLWYAALVGVLLAPQVHIGSVYTSPEIALVIGNVFAFVVSPKHHLLITVKQKLSVARSTAEFVFTRPAQFAFQPGQYMEFTLPHDRPDARGARRWFTLASSPTEPDLRLGVKFYERGSSFKAALYSLDKQTPMVAAQLAGDFVMPKDTDKKLAFIAGGIGVTPFRSMVKYLVDSGEQRSVRMLYAAKTADDIAYRDVFEAARQAMDIQTTYVLSDAAAPSTAPHTVNGLITSELIQQQIPDYKERFFFISGTHPMVEAMQDILADVGVPAGHIKIDFFPGYA
ncbi:MAG TPA: RnfABCDGE type electron transport complex subunit D [Candidatus Saccharimonadales bacterium]|nr:RnfABCDGE type electron transport complex subunit D [Candidatus Saccharimonadales bacterium]